VSEYLYPCRVGMDLLGARLVVDLRAEHRLAPLAVRCRVDLVKEKSGLIIRKEG